MGERMMAELIDELRNRWGSCTARVAAACARCGRDPASVQIVAVTKQAPIPVLEAFYQLGIRHWGESRPQQLAQRAAAFPPDIEWHQIGHLQRNKVGLIVPHVVSIDAVDSLRLLSAIDEAAGKSGRRRRVLLEVNISGEAAKSGFTPDELRTVWEPVQQVQHLEVAGLMTMAPLTDDTGLIRHVFRGLRTLRDELATRGPWALPELSMGMSGDFELAIEEGATQIRPGSVLFEGLNAS